MTTPGSRMTLTKESEALLSEVYGTTMALTVFPARLAAIEAAVRAEQAAEMAELRRAIALTTGAFEAEFERLRAALTKALEVIRDAERELHVWVDRDRERHPGWPDVGYEPWNNKPSLVLWAVDADEVEREARAALAATPVAPAPAATERCAACGHETRFHAEGQCDCEGDGKAGLCPCPEPRP